MAAASLSQQTLPLVDTRPPHILPPVTRTADARLHAYLLALYRLQQAGHLTRHRKRMWTISDGFCGAGGSSLGARMAGLWVRFAMNHSQISLKTHAHNFPECEHWQVNISAIDPHNTPDTDFLWMSPECTNHSNSKGESFKDIDFPGLWSDREEDELKYRSRMTMYDVHRFAEAKMDDQHPYLAIFVENVVEVHKWGYYHLWLADMEKLGYAHKTVYLNAQFFAPTPQSRDRWYTVFWLRDLPAPNLDFRPEAYCPRCEENIGAEQHWKSLKKKYGKYRQQYIYRCPECLSEVQPYYYAAINAIDWSIETPLIKDRPNYKRLRPLKEKTKARIEAGLYKFATAGEENEEQQLLPFVMDVCRTYQDGSGYTYPITDPLPTQTTAQSLALVIPPAYRVDWDRLHGGYDPGKPLPFLVSYYSNGKPMSSLEPFGAFTSKHRYAMVQPPASGIPSLTECGFRMLGVEEAKNGMGFLPDYQILYEQEAHGVRQCGLAVCPPVAKWLIERVLDVLEPLY